jgi:hypothetical protein
VASLSQRAIKPRSAQEIIRQALDDEREEQQRAAQIRREIKARQDAGLVETPARRPPLVKEATRIIERSLKGLGPIQVSNSLAVEDRDVLRALWRAHRAHFAADGKLEQVVAAGAVLDALDRVPEGRLMAAHVLTQASDYLVWIDLDHSLPLAAFANARAYFVQQDES